MCRNLLLALACSFALGAAAQPTWRFHLAFEDGTGARDTIWMVYDTSATVGWDSQPQVDYALGEGAAQIDHSVFNVFTWNWDGDSTKTHAYPYSWYPILDGTIIDAINWTPPMTITWDTSLFHAPYLPYAQGHFGKAVMEGIAFSQFPPTGPGFGVYDMLIHDSVTIDFLSEYLFQIPVYFGPVDEAGIGEKSENATPVRIRPNPAQDRIWVQSISEGVVDMSIHDLAGRCLLRHAHVLPSEPVIVSMLSPGLYDVRIINSQNKTYHGLFEKIP